LTLRYAVETIDSRRRRQIARGAHQPEHREPVERSPSTTMLRVRRRGVTDLGESVSAIAPGS
jgi:hypothetical protein